MRMPAHQLLGHTPGDIIKAEKTLFLTQLRIEHHLEQQVPKLATQFCPVLALDGVSNLVGLLYRVRRNRREVLLEVPGAAMIRVAEARHNLK